MKHPLKLPFSVIIFLFSLLILSDCNKYSEKMNSPDYEKLLQLEKPYRIQKLNLVWQKATKKLPPEKLKILYTDLKFQDKEELAWKNLKASGQDKTGLKESMIQTTFKAILEKYNLQDDFLSLQDATILTKPTTPDMSDIENMKFIFRDKKLNKLWLKAEKQGFSANELQTLKEEFQHHQDKIDQYYQIINQLDKDPDDNNINSVDHVLHAEISEKIWKSDNPHQVLKEKYSQLKTGYDYLNKKIIPNIKNTEFEEPQVSSLWEMAKNASFSNEELESLKSELHHFEHRVRKLKTLTALELEKDDSNIIEEVALKRTKKLKEFSYKVEKIQKELTSRILQRHSEL